MSGELLPNQSLRWRRQGRGPRIFDGVFRPFRGVVCARFRCTVWISSAPKGAIFDQRNKLLIMQAEEGALADPHQAVSIIATALCDARKDRPDHAMSPEEAKQIAKCIVEALSDAGLQISPVRSD